MLARIICLGRPGDPLPKGHQAFVANGLLAEGQAAIISFSAHRSASGHLLQMMQSSGMAAFYLLVYPAAHGKWRQVSGDYKTYADGNAPATLVDGDKSIDFYTLGESHSAGSFARASKECRNNQERGPGLHRCED
jgi:Tfp pilus assembly protein PilV